MKRDAAIIATVGILELILVLLNQWAPASLVILVLIAYSSYCGYYYQGKKRILIAIGVPILFVVSFTISVAVLMISAIMIRGSYISLILGLIPVLVWLGAVVYIALYATKPSPIDIIPDALCSPVGTEQ